MTSLGLNWITNYIWGIGNDILRHVYVRGKFRENDSVRNSYKIGFARYLYKPVPMRALEEIRDDVLALRAEYANLPPDFVLREPSAEYRTKLRIYVDTSVIGGCEEHLFQIPSRRLFEMFEQGRAIMVFSDLTDKELQGAPEPVRAFPEQVPESQREAALMSQEARNLADAYIASGAISVAHYNDALHVAIATISRVDFIASWNFNHMVNFRLVDEYNVVNEKLGYSEIDIQTPNEITHER